MSAGKRMEQGQKLEDRGRPADAAARYVDALRRDPSLAEARERLRVTGAQAVADYLRAADAADQGNAPGEAADLLLRLDDLRRDASAVGVALEVPADYATRRREILDSALDDAQVDATDLANAGRWGEAVGRIDRALGRWQPSREMRDDLLSTKAEIYFGWADAEADRGRYRAAYDVAARALSDMGRGYPGMDELVAVQARAVEEGTVRVAILPVISTTGVEDEVPVDWLEEVNDALDRRAWHEPPLFVQIVDPAEVRREMRRAMGGGSARPGAVTAAAVARGVGADVVVRMSLDSVRTEERDVREERRVVKLRTGADTAYTVRSGTRVLWARLRYEVLDVGTRESLREDVFSATGDARFREAAFEGNWRQLVLGREDQALFDTAERSRQRHALWGSLTDEMADRAGRDLLDALSRLID